MSKASVAYASRAHVSTAVAQLSKLGLSPDHAESLRYLFQYFEGECGVHSTFGAQCDRLANASGRGAPPAIDIDGTLCPIASSERWSLTTPGEKRRNVLKAYRTITSMQRNSRFERSAIVLFKIYGPRDPNVNYVSFGDLAPIVHLTVDVRELAEKKTRALRRAMALDAKVDDIARYMDQCHVEVAPRDALEEHLRKSSQTKTERATFVSSLKIEAHRMLIRASSDYMSVLQGVWAC